MKKLVVANWKMQPDNFFAASRLVSGYKLNRIVETVICPPTIFLQKLSDKHKNYNWGSQDCFWEDSGAYTGQIAPTALKSAGARYVIIGHSEKRMYGHETDKEVKLKILAAGKSNLTSIVCVGGGTATGSGKAAMAKVVKFQLLSSVKPALARQKRKIIVAYEPVWAIGTGKNADPTHVAEIFSLIDKILPHTSLLYGGSVTSNNARQYTGINKFGGFLVGGASLKPGEYNKIIKSISG